MALIYTVKELELAPGIILRGSMFESGAYGNGVDEPSGFSCDEFDVEDLTLTVNGVEHDLLKDVFLQGAWFSMGKKYEILMAKFPTISMQFDELVEKGTEKQREDVTGAEWVGAKSRKVA